MKLTTAQVALLGMASTVTALPKLHLPPLPDHAKANAVKQVYQTSWDGYYEHAFPNDNLHPVDNTFDNGRNAWGATAIDGLSTAIVMGNRDVVNKVLDYVPRIDFTTTKNVNDSISLFETNIRYLGGLISAYDMLNGPYRYLVNNPRNIKPLLDQAVSLADSLSIAFDTPSGIPDGFVILNPSPRQQGDPTNNVAEAGTLILEWTHLSDLTGNPKYAKLAERCQAHLLDPKAADGGELNTYPGLVGTDISVANGTFVSQSGGWSGAMDSFYEYLIKMYLYDPKTYGNYKDRWVLAADSTMAHLASHPTSRKDLTFLSQYDQKQTFPASGHLASFAGGNFILAGILLNEQKYVDFGLQITESYIETYTGSASGIGPEGFQWVDSAQPANTTNNPTPPAVQQAHYDDAGFYTTSGQYILRPETMESLYYAYRVTGDRKWQQRAWQAFSAVKQVCRAGSAYSGITNTDAKNGGGFDNNMQSFWLAEMLKYSYLIFADESVVQVRGDGLPNTYVFNTEAHPVKVRHPSFHFW